MTSRRFPIRFDRWYRAMSVAVLVPPSDSWIEVGPAEVACRMSWAFRARFPLAAVASAEPVRTRRVLSRGVHGLAGRWLVNGSGKGIVSIALDPPQRAYVMGFPVRLRELDVSVEDPDGLRAALGSAPASAPSRP